MENDISDFIKKYNIKLVMPSNADGWKCEWRNCGWCCVTERTAYHNKNKCTNFDMKSKECEIYKERLIDCKIYPFMIIPTKDGINLTPSLNCPYVMSSVKMNKLLITDVLIEKDVRDLIESHNYLHRRLFSNIKTNIDDCNISQINDKIKSLTDIKNLEDLKEIILKIEPLSILDIFKKDFTCGAYIQPNFSIDRVPNPIVMNIRLTKKNHIIFKSKINTRIIKALVLPDTIIIDDPARMVLTQYIELNINRHLEFLSFNICRLKDPYINPEKAYAEIWKSNLNYLYMHLISLVLRENVNVIDNTMMREALSMSDSRLNTIIYTNLSNPTNILSA